MRATLQPTARELAGRIRAREVSAVELLEAALARIAELNPSLNAIVSLDADRALRAAERADVAMARGEDVGPLHGVPMTLKDGHEVAGLRTTLGAAPFDRMADRDGSVATRLRAAGAVLIGHTNVPPFLSDYQTSNEIFGRTVNPWDPDRTPGGSSGGAAAALAAGLTPLEVGSDLTGSLRLPAHFCGVYGLKPTEHRVPLTGFFRQPAGTPRSVRIMLTLGPMARDLDDLALSLRIIAGPDGHDSDVPPVGVGDPPGPRVDRLRVAIAEALPGSRTDAAMRSAVTGVATRLAAAGARVERRLPAIDWESSNEVFNRLLGAVTGIFAPDAGLEPEQPTLAWYLEALDRRDVAMAAWETFFEDVDVLILPPAMTPAFLHAKPYSSIAVDGRQVAYLENGGLLVFANYAGLPALVVPAGVDPDGLPTGVQLVGPKWSDVRLIATARAMEQAGLLPGFRSPSAIV